MVKMEGGKCIDNVLLISNNDTANRNMEGTTALFNKTSKHADRKDWR
jgi:hypothetical protein